MLIMVIIITKRLWSFIKHKKKNQYSILQIHVLLSGLNHYKATGPNSISAYFLKELSNELAPINFSIIPTPRASTKEWKVANIIPIYKNCSRIYTQICNYCPISLPSTYVVKSFNILCTAASSPT